MSAARVRLWLVACVGGAGLLTALVHALVVVVEKGAVGPLTWTLLGGVPLFVVAVWLVGKRPDHPQARRLLVLGAAGGAGQGLEVLAKVVDHNFGPGAVLLLVNMAAQYTGIVGIIAGTCLLATYPDGVVERGWQRVVLRAVWCQLALPPLVLVAAPRVVIGRFLLDPPTTVVSNPFAISWLYWLAPVQEWVLNYYGVLLGPAVLAVRYITMDSAQRRRMLPLVLAVMAAFTFSVADEGLALVGVSGTSVWRLLTALLSLASVVMIPVAIVVGVLRHRLFDVDVVVRRSVVYGGLSLGIAVLYAGLAAAPGLALGGDIPVELAVVVTMIAALAFQPVRRRLEALADRWVFGDRVNRYQLLSSFGATLERTVDLSELLPTLAATVRKGLGAAWVRVSLSGNRPGSWLEEPRGLAGQPSGTAEMAEELRRGTDVLGRIECGPKPGGYQPEDRELLTTLAAQSATAIANVRLTARLAEQLEDLSRSRTRIVAAQDAERRRIERDIHDGVQQEVVALITKLRLASNKFGRHELSDATFEELQHEARELLVDLRELAHGIHPPVLSDNGLVAAVQARAARLPLDVQVIADDALRTRRLGTQIEGAAYFIVCEALTNVVKHARATATTVELATAGGHLRLTIRDNGRGMGTAVTNGSGMTNLRDRVEAVGGRLRIDSPNGSGTRIFADLPLEAPA